jgi:hypothetical protein
VDQSFVENFPSLINEENISQETNLLNIDPRLIRLERDSLRASQQSAEKEASLLERRTAPSEHRKHSAELLPSRRDSGQRVSRAW